MAERRACGCADFSRSELLHRAVAEAGRGLPVIEAGMPLPAGTGLTRRALVVRSLGLALSVYGGSRLSAAAFEDGIAQAAATGGDRVLVSVFLDGGADSLSILAPVFDGRYQALRPTLRLEPSGLSFAEDPRLQWHPAAKSLATLHAEGKLTVFPAVGYTGPDQSHFTSRHYWEVGATSVQLLSGWLGRYLDRSGSPDNPLQGLSLENRLQPALATERVPVASVDGPDRYTLPAERVSGDVESRMLEALAALAQAHAGAADPALRELGAVTLEANRLRGQLVPFAGKSSFGTPVPYPSADRDPFPRRLAGLAAMLAGGLPLRCVALTAPGMYDTHSDQPQALTEGLKLTADSLLAFQRDLEARGLADRVLVHVWSEFGRRAQENASLGTDHGAAGIGFLVGSRASGRMVGEFPGLTSGLDAQGNLRPTSDFRGIYSGLLEQWLETDATAIVPGAAGFPRPPLLK